MFDQAQNASKLVMDKIEGWIASAIIMLPNFALALLILIIFIVISKIVTGILRKTLFRVIHNGSVVNLIISVTSFVIIAIGFFVALGVLNLDKTVTSLLAGVGVIGLALGFAFQDAAANFISGISMAVKSPINEGDVIEYEDYYGVVTKIGLRATILRIPDGHDVVIPNRLIFQNPYKHFTVRKERRIDLKCGISYGDDLSKVESLVKQTIEKIPYLMAGKPVEFFYEEFGDSSINFVVRYWIAFTKPVEFFEARHEGIMLIKKAFDENDIMIPFPIRTLDFGIKGGEKLSAMINDKKPIG